MSKIQAIIKDIRNQLTGTFADIDTWFDKDAQLLDFRPANGRWTINEILEHIGLTNHFLLILIEKGARKAIQNTDKHNLAEELENYTFYSDKLTEVGLHQSFEWIRPEHMEPKGEKELPEIRLQLKEQVAQCLQYLDTLQNGEGILYKTTMTVNNLGKIDVYQYIYFLAQHGQRHIAQMEKNEMAYLTVK